MKIQDFCDMNKFEEIMNNVTTVIVNIDKNKLVDLVDVEFIEKIDFGCCKTSVAAADF